MHVITVARALSEILKIFGALGIVNLFSLSLLYRSSITLTGVPDGANMKICGIAVQSIRPLLEPDMHSIVSGIVLTLIFIRFFYGSMILLEGEYVRNDNRPNHIRFFDFLPVIFFLPMFSIMSFYGGLGKLAPFSGLLCILLVIDACTMWRTIDDTSRYERERKRWTIINGSMAFLVFILYVFYTQWTHKSDVSAPEVLYTFIAIYCVASVVDLRWNRSFYFGGRN